MKKLFLSLLLSFLAHIPVAFSQNDGILHDSLELCKEPFFELNQNINTLFAQNSLHQMMCVRDLNLSENLEIHVVDDAWFDEHPSKETSQKTALSFDNLDILLNLDQSPFASQTVQSKITRPAYYNKRDNQLFLRGSLAHNNPVLFYTKLYHELIHVLQYQSLEQNEDNILSNPILLRVIRDRWGEDAISAILALTEGDAEFSTALAFSKPEPFIQTLLPDLKSSSVDNFLHSAEKSTLTVGIPDWVHPKMFAYIKGPQFVKKLWESDDQGWEKINKSYFVPPLSTEMILHPDAYLRRDKSMTPIAVKHQPIVDALSSYSNQQYILNVVEHRTAGELGWINRLLIHNNLPFSAIETAAAGWGGDIEILFEKSPYFTSPDFFSNTTQRFLLSKTVWDSPQDAREFVNAWKNRQTTFNQVSIYKPAENAVYILISEDLSSAELSSFSEKL